MHLPRERHPAIRRLTAAVALALAAPAAWASARAALSLERVGWSAVELEGGKLGIGLETRIELQPRPARAVLAELAAPQGPPGVQPAAERVLEIRLDSSFLRRRSEIRAWVDPESARALERVQRDTGSRLRTKISRYEETGIRGLRIRPERGEEDLPAERWSDRDRTFEAYGEVAGEPPPVSDPAALIYAAAASSIDEVGETERLALFVDDELVEVTIRAIELRRVAVDFERIHTCGGEAVRGPMEALRLTLETRALAPSGGAREIELAGLRGRIEILLARESRLPLEISGSVPYAGRVVIRLARAHCRESRTAG